MLSATVPARLLQQTGRYGAFGLQWGGGCLNVTGLVGRGLLQKAAVDVALGTLWHQLNAGGFRVSMALQQKPGLKRVQ